MFLKENRKNESLTLTCNSLSSFSIIFFSPQPLFIHLFSVFILIARQIYAN